MSTQPEPEDDIAMIAACTLVTALLRGGRADIYYDLRDPRPASRVMLQLARLAAANMTASGRALGRTEDEARQDALECLAEQVAQCELGLLDVNVVYDPATSMIRHARA